jgi:LPXTG-motif cell wall-anchored protein
VTNPVTITVSTSGAVVKDASAGDPNASHLHYFIDRDPATVLRQGEPIPTGQPDIIHTADTTEVLPNLSPGPHTVWVVLAHTDHTPFSPNVQDQVRFTVGNGAAAAAGVTPTATVAQLPPGGTGGLLSNTTGDGSINLIVWLGLATAAALATAGVLLVRRRSDLSDSNS